MSRMLSRIATLSSVVTLLGALAAAGLSGCTAEPAKSGGQEQGKEKGGGEAAKKAPAATGKFELVYYDLPG